MTYIEDNFEPYLIDLPWGGKFLIGTPLAQRWYDPTDTPLKVELDWIVKYVNLRPGRKVIDGGCHHGLYSVVMGRRGAEVYAVDLHQPNIDMTIANCAINSVEMSYGLAAITNQVGTVTIADAQLGSVVAEGKDTIRSVRLFDICPDANVVKLDIEGCEFLVLPEALDEMQDVDTWIVEVHPWWYEVSGKKDLFTPFIERGYDLFWIERSDGDNAKVEELSGEIVLKMQSTLIAIRES